MSKLTIFRCRSCNAPVRWAITERGRRMPLDVEPSDEGNILLQDREGREPLAVVLTKGQIAAFDGSLQRHRLHRSHFATCPHGKHWRKGAR